MLSLNAYNSFTSSMSDETAVFRCIRSSMSAVTRRIVSCVLRRTARSASVHPLRAAGTLLPPTVFAQWSTSRHTRTRNLKLPSRPLSLHSTSFSGGATNITYRRSESAPYFASISSGSTTLPFDLDMTAPSLSTIP